MLGVEGLRSHYGRIEVLHGIDVVKIMKALDVTMLLVEQNAYGALTIADRGYVLETGRVTMSGSAVELVADPRSREGYLGI